MPAYPILRFVNSIAASPVVDLDLNLGQPFTTHRDEFTIGAPVYSGDPLSVGVQWGYRTLTLVTQASGVNTTSMAAHSALAKQVTVDNLLMFQLDSTSPPVFFKTYKTQPDEIDMSNVISDSGQSYWRLSVQLTADHAAVGLPETGTVTIANDPAAASNPCFYWFGGTVKGDLETPLYLEAPASDVRGQTRMLSSQALSFNTPVSTTPTNKVTNPSFETDVSNWTLVANTTLTREVLPAGAVDGVSVGTLKSTGATDPAAYSNEFATTPGQVFSGRVFVKWKTGSTPRSCWVGVRWLNAAHTLISDDGGSIVATNASSWTELTVLNKTAPASTAFVRLWFWTVSSVTGEEAMYDAAQLENSATLPAYNPARMSGPVLVQANALTAGTTVGGGVAPVGAVATNTGDAAMSGGNYTRYTGNASDDGATAGLPVNLLYGLNLLPGTLVGDYRILMRVRCGAAVDVWSFAIAQIAATSPNYALYTGDVVSYVRSTTGPHWLDMGVFRFPFGAPPLDPVAAFDTPYTNPGISLAVMMFSNAVASKTIDFDCLLFVPVGLDQAQATQYATTAYDKSLPGTTYKSVWNGINDTRYLLDTSANYSPGVAPIADGELPTLVPGTDNSIHYLQHIGTGCNDPRTGATTGTDDVLTATTALTWKYWPRYLWLRPAGG